MHNNLILIRWYMWSLMYHRDGVNHLGFIILLGSRVELPLAAASKQQASKQASKHEWAKIRTPTQWFRVKCWCMIAMGMKYNHTNNHAGNSTVAAGNGRHKWQTQVSKSVKNGQKISFWGQFGCLGCLWRGPFTSEPI